VTSHSPIAGPRLFSEVVTGEEDRAVTLDSVPSEARPPDSHHPRPWGFGRTVNRPLQERSHIGLSPPPVVAVASSIRVHTLQGRVMDALAEVASDRRLVTWFRSSGRADPSKLVMRVQLLLLVSTAHCRFAPYVF
jgi:hypothetical protein